MCGGNWKVTLGQDFVKTRYVGLFFDKQNTTDKGERCQTSRMSMKCTSEIPWTRQNAYTYLPGSVRTRRHRNAWTTVQLITGCRSEAQAVAPTLQLPSVFESDHQFLKLQLGALSRAQRVSCSKGGQSIPSRTLRPCETRPNYNVPTPQPSSSSSPTHPARQTTTWPALRNSSRTSCGSRLIKSVRPSQVRTRNGTQMSLSRP